MKNNVTLLIILSFLLGTLAFLETTQATIPTTAAVKPADIPSSQSTNEHKIQKLYSSP